MRYCGFVKLSICGVGEWPRRCCANRLIEVKVWSGVGMAWRSSFRLLCLRQHSQALHQAMLTAFSCMFSQPSMLTGPIAMKESCYITSAINSDSPPRRSFVADATSLTPLRPAGYCGR